MARVRSQRASKRVQFVEVATAPVLKLEVDDGRPLDGAFVKLTPRLRRADREAFDVRAAERGLLARGAVAAIAVPVVIPDEPGTHTEARPAQMALDSREQVVAWFGADAADDAAAARDACLAILDEVGL